jgi:hypothetical protein
MTISPDWHGFSTPRHQPTTPAEVLKQMERSVPEFTSINQRVRVFHTHQGATLEASARRECKDVLKDTARFLTEMSIEIDQRARHRVTQGGV